MTVDLDPRHIDDALRRLRAIADPLARVREADRVDAALAQARAAVAQIKKESIMEMRTPARGYGTLASRLGITKGRVQQIVNAPTKGYPVAYAFRDADGVWHGEPDLLPRGRYADCPTPRPFEPADEFNPLHGQELLVRCGEVPKGVEVSLYTVHIVRQDGVPTVVRSTEAVQDALFGPPILGTPERTAWDARREARRLALEAERAS